MVTHPAPRMRIFWPLTWYCRKPSELMKEFTCRMPKGVLDESDAFAAPSATAA